MKCNRSFWPQGRDRWVVIALLVMISGIGGYTLYATFQLLELSAAIPTQHASTSERERPVFNMANASIHEDHIVHGGPKKDGIPSIDRPRFTSVRMADLNPQDRVITVTIDEETHIYPLRILQWHEIVNDKIEDTPIVVIYCPLCDSVTVFDRRVENRTLEFGVSGLLYQSNVLIYDRHRDDMRESLWSQLAGEAVTGPRTGQKLTPVPHQLVCWDQASQQFPDAEVLSFQTGHKRKYDILAYGSYFTDMGILFPVNHVDELFHAKERMLGVVANGEARAYPIAFIEPGTTIVDSIGGEELVFDVLGNGHVMIDDNPNVQVVHSLWFAWVAFFPETTVYDGPEFDLVAWEIEREEAPQLLPMFDTSAYNERHQSSCALSPSSSATEGE